MEARVLGIDAGGLQPSKLHTAELPRGERTIRFNFFLPGSKYVPIIFIGRKSLL
jgi:hypothetical protein